MRTPKMAKPTYGDVVMIGAISQQDATDFFTKSLVRKDLLRDDGQAAQRTTRRADVPASRDCAGSRLPEQESHVHHEVSAANLAAQTKTTSAL
jgi:hypothetical protein